MLNTSTIRGTFKQIPYWKLRGRFHSCGYRDQEVAEYIGIGRDTMSGRMQGHNPWTSTEITAMCELLGIRQNEIGEYSSRVSRKENPHEQTVHPCIRAGRRAHRMRVRAPTFWNKWFRWDGSRASGCYQLGGQVKDETHTGLQVFADGEWHPVIGWTLDSCGPATDYQEVGA